MYTLLNFINGSYTAEQHNACLKVVRECMILLLIERWREEAIESLCGSRRRLNKQHFLDCRRPIRNPLLVDLPALNFLSPTFNNHILGCSDVLWQLSGEALDGCVIVEEWKMLRASTVARVGLNHRTITGHITFAALKAATASIRSTLNFRKNHCIAGCTQARALCSRVAELWLRSALAIAAATARPFAKCGAWEASAAACSFS